jgi:hypothetical protein
LTSEEKLAKKKKESNKALKSLYIASGVSMVFVVL